jgi:hypothetical protein
VGARRKRLYCDFEPALVKNLDVWITRMIIKSFSIVPAFFNVFLSMAPLGRLGKMGKCNFGDCNGGLVVFERVQDMDVGAEYPQTRTHN